MSLGGDIKDSISGEDNWRDVGNEIRNRKQNVRYAELAAFLVAAGFSLCRSKGSHRIFCKPGCRVQVSLKDEPGQVRIGHVTTALAAAEECGDD